MSQSSKQGASRASDEDAKTAVKVGAYHFHLSLLQYQQTLSMLTNSQSCECDHPLAPPIRASI